MKKAKVPLLCAIAALLGVIATWFIFANRMNEEWRRASAVAVGGGYSISLMVKSTHPFLAEYEQKLEVFGGTAREGDLLKTCDLPMNTGGRVRILLFRSKFDDHPEILLRDRYANSVLNLRDLQLSTVREVNDEDYVFLGAFSGEAYPLKFVPQPIWELMANVDK